VCQGMDLNLDLLIDSLAG